jgi:hypothetical protein
MPAALEKHLAECGVCRRALAESRELVGSLRAALGPEPLSSRLERQLQDELDQRTLSPARFARRRLNLAVLAAAAAVLIAVLIPSGPVSRPEAVAWSEEDAAEIVAAIVLLEWGDPLSCSIDQVSASLDDIERSMKREGGSGSVLPWGSEDDWDQAPMPDEGSPNPPDQPRTLRSHDSPECLADMSAGCGSGVYDVFRLGISGSSVSRAGRPPLGGEAKS